MSVNNHPRLKMPIHHQQLLAEQLFLQIPLYTCTLSPAYMYCQWGQERKRLPDTTTVAYSISMGVEIQHAQYFSPPTSSVWGESGGHIYIRQSD